jgi:hypothetical protein
MRRGYNRADIRQDFLRLSERVEALTKSSSIIKPTPCIFISHKREDTEACQMIADYILDAGIDVYFDKYDKTLMQLVEEGDPNKLTQRIKDGINKSTHMLCVVSIETVRSYWVPFEVGFGYERVPLGILTLKGVQESSLPDYMRTTEVIRGTKTLNELISRLLGETERTLESREQIKGHTMQQHPLDRVLDWNQ